MNKVPELTVEVNRCYVCRRPVLVPEIEIDGACPHCGNCKFTGSGRTTKEEESELRRRVVKRYEQFRDYYTSRIGREFLPGGKEPPKFSTLAVGEPVYIPRPKRIFGGFSWSPRKFSIFGN